MFIIMPCIHLLITHLLKYVWGTFLNHQWNCLLKKKVKKMDIMIQIKIKGSFKRFNMYIKKYKRNYRRPKPSIRKGMINIRLIIGDQVWLHINKDIMKGEGKKLIPL